MTQAVNLPRAFQVLMVLWLMAALAAGGAGMLNDLSPQLVGAMTGLITVLLLTLMAGWRALREWLLMVDLRLLIAIHLLRLIGIAFLVMGRRGALPREFAQPAGWGDIAVAVTALGVIWVLSLPLDRFPRSVLAWNILGLMDIIVAVSTALRLAESAPGSMEAMRRLPLSLLPTLLVPIFIATHLMIFIRLWQDREQ